MERNQEEAEGATKRKRKGMPGPESKKKKKKVEEETFAEHEEINVVVESAKSGLKELFERLKASPPPERNAAAQAKLLDRVHELHTKIVDCFQGLTSTEAVDQLSDPSASTKLVLPTLLESPNGPRQTFTYVGRKKFQEFHALLNAKHRVTRLEGYPGRGKSYLMAAMACYLHAYEHEHMQGPVVYIQCYWLVGNLDYLVEALLLAYARQPEKQLDILARAGSVDDILEFCIEEEPLVFMEELNELENSQSTTRKQREEAACWSRVVFQRGVFCASHSFDFQPQTDHRLRLDEPFDMEELACWQRSRGLLGEDPHELLHHTGLVPRFLERYTRVKKADMSFRRKRLRRYLRGMKTVEDEVLARGILNGAVKKLGDLDTEIFYERRFGMDSIVSVLPCLEAEMTVCLIRNRKEAALARDIDLFRTHIKNVRRTLLEDSRRGILPGASLNGLLAESLTRECILLQRSCLGWDFKSLVVFVDAAADGEIHELSDSYAASDEALKAGVCFLPQHFFDAEDADMYVVKLSSDGKRFEVHAVQICVSAWRARKRKDAHVKWLSNVERIWSREGCELEYDFTYVLSNALEHEQDVVDVVNKVEKKKFSDVHEWLAFIDELKAPELELKKCKGKEKGEDCDQVK